MGLKTASEIIGLNSNSHRPEEEKRPGLFSGLFKVAYLGRSQDSPHLQGLRFLKCITEVQGSEQSTVDTMQTSVMMSHGVSSVRVNVVKSAAVGCSLRELAGLSAPPTNCSPAAVSFFNPSCG